MVTRRDWWIGVGAVLLATLLLGWLAGFGVDAQSGGLFIEVDPALAFVGGPFTRPRRDDDTGPLGPDRFPDCG